MDFTLFYRGELKAKSRGVKDHKHQIRKSFHPQLKVLWNQPPLKNHKYAAFSEFESPWIKNVGKFNFLPLVNESTNLVAGINILLLRPGAPGSIFTKRGDIDNRIKTIIDALKCPSENDIPDKENPTIEEDPFLCLMQDDKLIINLSVKTDRLLESGLPNNEVVLLIQVEVKQIAVPWSAFR